MKDDNSDTAADAAHTDDEMDIVAEEAELCKKLNYISFLKARYKAADGRAAAVVAEIKRLGKMRDTIMAEKEAALNKLLKYIPDEVPR